jgi:hypothetical protein
MTHRIVSFLTSRLLAVLGICAICLGASSDSCSFFGIDRRDTEVTMDLAVEAPADLAVTQVVVSLRGLEFRNSEGSTRTLEFRDPESIDLIDERSAPFRMFTDEELPEGHYTGVRLLFDEEDPDDAFVVLRTGEDFPLALAAGDYAAIDFTVAEDDSDDQALTLTLGLRQALIFDDDADEYTLRPRLRAVSTEDAASISGTVNVTCPSGELLVQVGAVYLFTGEDAEPDDIDSTGVEPYATAPVTSQLGYSLRFLPAGRYTLALTCRADEEDAAVSDDLAFRNATNVRIERREAVRRDIFN